MPLMPDKMKIIKKKKKNTKQNKIQFVECTAQKKENQTKHRPKTL